MKRKVNKPTTRVVGPLKRHDQRDELHTQAAMGRLGEKVKKWWTAESVDPFRRIFYPETRPQNVPMRSWRGVAEGPVNPKRTEVKNKKRMSAIIKETSKFLGADLVGICNLNQDFVFTHRGLRIDFHKKTAGDPIKLDYKYAISIGIEMEHKLFRNSPDFVSDAAVGRGYFDTSQAAVSLAAWIREIGWEAKAHSFINEELIHIPIAVEAGLGELARNGSLITQEFGPRLRLSTVTTNLPMEIDQPIDIGIQDMCNTCNKCAINCPAQCIPYGPKTIKNNVEKWSIDNVACMKYWVNKHERFNGCARCISTCPLNLKNNFWTRVITWGIPKWHWWRKAIVVIDNIIRGRKPNPKQEWLFYKVPGPKKGWTIPPVID